MTKKKSFKMDGNSTIEQLMNYQTPEETTGIVDITEVDEDTRNAILNKIEKHDKKVLLLMKPSTHETLKEMAWQDRRSLNAFINKVLEEYIEKESK